jgi:hypothetical protein
MTDLGGFPWRCFDTCETPADCVMDGCIKLWLEKYVKDKLDTSISHMGTWAVRWGEEAMTTEQQVVRGEKKR